VSSLRELPRDVAPERDLWPEIEARLAAERDAGPARFRWKPRLNLLALAAVISAVAVGVWLGRNVLPGANQPAAVTARVNPGSDAMKGALGGASALPAAYVKHRAALLASFEQQVRMLPPESRDKVLASLAAIRKSMSDIQEALGREPGNALLQELLVNTYQDEMRVLTVVHEAGDARKEI
jgi:hypothetical protein